MDMLEKCNKHGCCTSFKTVVNIQSWKLGRKHIDASPTCVMSRTRVSARILETCSGVGHGIEIG